jgi:large subunit ribosomal protein L10
MVCSKLVFACCLDSRQSYFNNQEIPEKGGDFLLAITKERKSEIVEQHSTWLKESKAVVLTEYIGLSSQALEQLRLKVRDAGGEMHVVKNTLGKIVFEKANLQLPEDAYEGSTAITYAFENAPDIAKALSEFSKTSEFVKIKVGVLGSEVITAADVKALAELPPLPVLRAQILGTLMAPASQLARLLAEPGRQVARVIQAYADQETTGAVA